MKRISIDNGASFVTAAEAVQGASWDAITALMDVDTMEKVNAELAPCTEEEFLSRYLEIAQEDLIIG